MSIAILNSQGKVITFVRDDVPEGWRPPEGCTAIPENELAPDWERVIEIYDIEDVRRERNKKLSDSDWTQLIDCPLDQNKKIEWANYRQALRDLPQNYNGEGPIPWPQYPN